MTAIDHQSGRSALLDGTARAFGVTVPEMRGDTRQAGIVRARFAFCWVARRAFGDSARRTGRALGDRDHATVLHALRRADALREADPDFRAATDRLLAGVEGSADA